MDKRNINRLSRQIIYKLTATLIIAFCHLSTLVVGQSKIVEGNAFTKYKPSDFKPKRGLQYNVYFSPLLTVDPLGLGGKSTYAISIGSRINLWESKLETTQRVGLRVRGLYAAAGYEYFPKQFDNLYASLWLRLKTFMPISARMDALYSYGYGKQGVASRFCFGFEVKKMTVLLSGTIYSASTQKIFGDPPEYESPYANAGSIMLVIPIYNHPKP